MRLWNSSLPWHGQQFLLIDLRGFLASLPWHGQQFLLIDLRGFLAPLPWHGQQFLLIDLRGFLPPKMVGVGGGNNNKLEEKLRSFLAQPKAHRWAYSIPVLRRLSVRVHNFKHLLWNSLANQSQILLGASLGKGNESLFAASGSHDQDGHHAHIW